MKIINILKIVEPYYIVLSYGFIGFFIMMTSIEILPTIVKRAGKESYTPFFYALSMIFGYVYFAYYKVVKVLIKDNNENE